MSPPRLGLAVAVGLVLCALPFLRYVHVGHGLVPHADHAPRRGGVLLMVGDHHLELVRARDRIELFTSDAVRTPTRPDRALAGWSREDPIPLVWEGDRFVGPALRGAIDVVVVLPDGTRLETRFSP